MPKNVRGTVTVIEVLSKTGGKMPADFTDVTGLAASTYKLINHT